jgi:hypothetical protein
LRAPLLQRLIRALGDRLDAVADAAELCGNGGGGYGTAVEEPAALIAVGGVRGFPALPTSFIGAGQAGARTDGAG